MPRIRHIFRWDLDKTYLQTEFDTVRDLVRTARLSAEERENIPGSAALIRAIRDCAPKGERHLVYFISGSPEQMRSVIERKFALDGFIPDGFVLKPTVSNLLRGRFRSVRSQVDYKLGELIQMRAEAPVGTKETLFGDDAENDAFIYSLYSDVIAGRVDEATLAKILVEAGAYRDRIREIREALEAVVHEDPVHRIIIHLDRKTPASSFSEYLPRVVPIHSHLQTALILFLDGTLIAGGIRTVARELIARYAFDVERLFDLAQEILGERRSDYPAERLEKLALALESLDENPSSDADKDGGVEEKTKEVVVRIAVCARDFAARPLPREASLRREPPNYLALWKAEEKRHADHRRARRA